MQHLCIRDFFQFLRDICNLFGFAIINKGEGPNCCTILTNWLIFYLIVLVADLVHKIMLAISLIGLFATGFRPPRNQKPSLAMVIVGFIINFSHLIWFFSATLNMSSDSKQCLADNMIFAVTLLLAFILVIINITKMIFSIKALLFQSSGDI